MKNNVPFFALIIGYAGALANLLADAKSLIGACAALASLAASLYAIAISHQRLKRLRRGRRLFPSWRSLRSRLRRLGFLL